MSEVSNVVILAAGDFPRRGGRAWKVLSAASRVVCCDGAADAFRRRTGREPDAVVGDCDSVKGRFANVVRVDEQETNDLEKAARFCASKRWGKPVVLGATGKREDHTIGNVFRAMDLGLEIVTDRGRFVPVEGAATRSAGRADRLSRMRLASRSAATASATTSGSFHGSTAATTRNVTLTLRVGRGAQSA